MFRHPHNERTSRSAPSPVGPGDPRTYQPLLPDIPANPDSPVSEQAAEPIHEFDHPHHHHHPREYPFRTDEELDEVGGDAPVIAKELEEMQSRVWWRRPSALWFLPMIPFVLAASTSTSAPRVQMVIHLVCKTLRPEYADKPGDHPPSFFSASDGQEMKLCNADPVVQAASAEFLALISTASGVLTCLTAVYWGSRSDRKGRISTLRICMFGNLVTDLTYLFVYSLLRDRIGAYWFLLGAPLVEGLLGGVSSASVNIHAYIADCSDPSRRSRLFAIYLALLYIGVTIGPAFGGLLIRHSGSLLTVFYYAFANHLFYACMVWFVIPESLAPTQLYRAKVAYSESKSQARSGVLAHLASSFAPLKLFIPVTVKMRGNPLIRRNDWNLTFLAAAYGLVMMLMGVYSLRFQYAALTFGWNAEILGYWMSVAGLTHAIALAFVIPGYLLPIISLFKRLSSPIRPSTPSNPTTHLSPIMEDQDPPLQSTTSTSPAQGSTVPEALPGNPASLHSTAATAIEESKDTSQPHLDLNTARVSLVMELTSYSLMATAKTGTLFTIYTILGSLSAAYTPAVQSLALDIYASRGGQETGKLFGGLSVMQALSGSIISPVLFGFTYSRTVATFPQAIFVVGASVIALAFLCMLFIRLPKGGEDEPIVVTEDSAINDEERERLLSGDED